MSRLASPHLDPVLPSAPLLLSSPDDASSFYSVCHMTDSDTMLVCSGEKTTIINQAYWLAALSRNGSEWRVEQRVHTDKFGLLLLSCALSDSRVLIGGIRYGTSYMEMFRVKRCSGARIKRVSCIVVPEEYYSFSAKCGSDPLVAMSYRNGDKSVRVHRLRGNQLEELAHIRLECPFDSCDSLIDSSSPMSTQRMASKL